MKNYDELTKPFTGKGKPRYKVTFVKSVFRQKSLFVLAAPRALG